VDRGPEPSRAPAPPSGGEPEVRVVGAPRTPLRDFYHAFLRIRWPWALGLIVLGYLLLNGAFAVAYLASGGVANARPGSLLDAFYFSVQTMGTIGYGAMYPSTPAANALVVLESVTSLLVTAIATGLVFAKFSQSSARIAFTREAAIAPMNGVPTLMVRIGNERGNQIVDVRVRFGIYRTERTAEGMVFYRLIDLALSRERTFALSRSWTALHPITPESPLFGQSPASLKEHEVELVVTVVGVDDTSLQPVHARKRYLDHEIVWGARHVDILSEGEDGTLVLDVRKFHDLAPTEPTADFPYPAGG
jgi:inward rectifier potassium channel